MSKLSLDSVEWGEFKLIDIFEIKDGYYNKKPPINEKTKSTIPFLGATKYENGITAFYDLETIKKWDKVGKINTHNYEDRLYRGNCLAVTNNGSVGNIYFQNHTFTCSHDVTPLYLKVRKLNKYIAHFLATMLRKTAESFEYAKKWRPERMRSSKIMLPIDSNSDPNWKFMEDYIKQEMKVQSRKVASYYENKLMKLGFELLDLEVEWKEFKVKDLFEVKSVKGKSITYYKKGNIPYITTSSVDNGLNSFIDGGDSISIKRCISVDPIGGKAFYHDYDFVGRGGAGSAINLLYNKRLDKYSGLFICKMLESSSFSKASYGVQLNGNRLKNLRFLIPVEKNGEPHWKYMSNFIKKLEKENIEKTLNHIYIYIIAKKLENKYLLKNVSWKEFFIEDICEIKSGKDIYERDRIDGQTPYVTATANNNGIGYYISNENSTLQEKCISVNRNGSVGYSFYHSYPALFGNDTRKLIPKYSNDHVAKFISFMISSQKEKYGYGYKMGTARLKRQKILLPVNEEEVIDYDFMKKYVILQEIKSIEQFIHKYSED